jgi:hypothetical protein
LKQTLRDKGDVKAAPLWEVFEALIFAERYPVSFDDGDEINDRPNPDVFIPLWAYNKGNMVFLPFEGGAAGAYGTLIPFGQRTLNGISWLSVL